MILTDNTCSIYDFLTYDNQSSSFVDENFSKDSFITKNENPRKISKMIEKIGDMINSMGLPTHPQEVQLLLGSRAQDPTRYRRDSACLC